MNRLRSPKQGQNSLAIHDSSTVYRSRTRRSYFLQLKALQLAGVKVIAPPDCSARTFFSAGSERGSR